MNTNNHQHEQKSAADQRNWRRIHHSPLFWIGVFLFLAASAIYILSDNLFWRPAI
jgi:hypothetical protein